jgi:hypothetical protein
MQTIGDTMRPSASSRNQEENAPCSSIDSVRLGTFAGSGVWVIVWMLASPFSQVWHDLQKQKQTENYEQHDGPTLE